MKSPLAAGEWCELDEVDSTQRVAAERLLTSTPAGVVFAHNQTAGKGRFGRIWVSRRGESLTMSLVFSAYANHPKPWLIGMAVSIAAAGALKCQLRWPNDLSLDALKVGGLLTELRPDAIGRKVPVVGIGINLAQTAFPTEIAHRATSLVLRGRTAPDPIALAKRIIERIEDLPEPDSWQAIQRAWELFDDTPGKVYRLPDGTEALALGVGPEGELVCSIAGETTSVMAGEAFFGG
jgi:BirA family biotin operon repressor/biotin-[acetyl-CoA-carboxylase] ligase